MGWGDQRARLHKGVHRAFELTARYEDGGAPVPVSVNIRQREADDGDGEEVRFLDPITEMEFQLTPTFDGPQRNATVLIEATGRRYRVGRELARSAGFITMEVT